MTMSHLRSNSAVRLVSLFQAQARSLLYWASYTVHTRCAVQQNLSQLRSSTSDSGFFIRGDFFIFRTTCDWLFLHCRYVCRLCVRFLGTTCDWLFRHCRYVCRLCVRFLAGMFAARQDVAEISSLDHVHGPGLEDICGQARSGASDRDR